MRTLNNNIVLNNNLKSGKSDSIIDTIKLLAKLGLLETKKKKPKPKLMITDGSMDGGIRQNNKMAQVVTYGADDKGGKGAPFSKSGPTPSSGPLAIGDINQKEKELENIQNQIKSGELDPKQVIADIALLKNELKTANAVQQQAIQYSRNIEGQLFDIKSQKFRSAGPTVEEIDEQPKFSQSEEPFKNVRGQDSGFMEMDEQDFTNQGSQNLPDSVQQVDVSEQADDIYPDEEESTISAITLPEDDINLEEQYKTQKTNPEYKPEHVQVDETEDKKIETPEERQAKINYAIDTSKISSSTIILKLPIQSAFSHWNINEPKKSWNKDKINDWIASLQLKTGNKKIKQIDKIKTMDQFWKQADDYMKIITKDFFSQNPTFNKKTGKYELID